MRVAVIGGGFTGLSAAKKLLEAGYEVDIYDKGNRLGGLANSINIENTKLEIFYHHIFTSDHEIQDLIKELGLEKDLQWLESKMGFFVENKIYEFGTPVSLLKFKPLKLIDKIRFGLSVIRLQLITDWIPLEKITAKEWLIKNAGLNAYKICWEPLLTSKFGDKHDTISMAWFWGKIKLRGSTRSEAKTKEQLGYMIGSFEKLGDKLVQKVESSGAKIYLNSNIESIMSVENSIHIRLANRSVVEYDKVLVTVPLPIVPKIVKGLPKKYINEINKIEYTSVICTILTLNKPFSDIYWLNVGDTSIPFGGLIEHTNMVKDPNYNNKNILYISNYTLSNDPLNKASDEKVMSEYIKHLKKINPKFSKDWIEDVKIFRAQHAQPIITCNYTSLKPDFQTPIKGIYIANMTHIYPEDRGMNYAVKTGYEVAELIKNENPLSYQKLMEKSG